MLNAMTWDELHAWHEYAVVEPFGEERADLRAGIVASTIANANRDPKKRPRPFSAADFMPSLDKKPRNARRPMTLEQWQEAKGMAKAFTGGPAR